MDEPLGTQSTVGLFSTQHPDQHNETEGAAAADNGSSAAAAAAGPAAKRTKRGRKSGVGNWRTDEKSWMLTCVDAVLPLGAHEWERVALQFNLGQPAGKQQSVEQIKRQLKRLREQEKPTGDNTMHPLVQRAQRIHAAMERKCAAASTGFDADDEPSFAGLISLSDMDDDEEEEGERVEFDGDQSSPQPAAASSAAASSSASSALQSPLTHRLTAKAKSEAGKRKRGMDSTFSAIAEMTSAEQTRATRQHEQMLMLLKQGQDQHNTSSNQLALLVSQQAAAQQAQAARADQQNAVLMLILAKMMGASPADLAPIMAPAASSAPAPPAAAAAVAAHSSPAMHHASAPLSPPHVPSI